MQAQAALVRRDGERERPAGGLSRRRGAARVGRAGDGSARAHQSGRCAAWRHPLTTRSSGRWGARPRQTDTRGGGVGALTKRDACARMPTKPVGPAQWRLQRAAGLPSGSPPAHYTHAAAVRIGGFAQHLRPRGDRRAEGLLLTPAPGAEPVVVEVKDDGDAGQPVHQQQVAHAAGWVGLGWVGVGWGRLGWGGVGWGGVGPRVQALGLRWRRGDGMRAVTQV
jgi:hypothetical protein